MVGYMVFLCMKINRSCFVNKLFTLSIYILYRL